MFKETENLRPDLIVFTDLDGTLLDHHDYSFSAAQQALETLSARNLPLVLASSKTAAEMQELAEQLPCRPAALMVENGAGVVWPGEAPEGESRHAALLEVLVSLPAELRALYEGFTDWGPEGVARETGLPLPQARLAAQRAFSEPGLWRGDEPGRAAFIAALANHGVTARQGGRYLTLSFGADKADRMHQIAARLAPGAHVLALGDAPNDIGMLEAADTGVIVTNPDGAGIATLAGESTGQIRRTRAPGPRGWNEAVLQTIEEMTSAARRS
ncbi:HAD-IIB family hydrolase [Vannielia litorea]|uniref:HAD-IIB family hydrolase n=1 Tax=Vannielia litorea TaxID=1217970 RepID=UPI001C96BDEA|nr:HAD-IIB family hydrolase [Vannielia litorea]MBY6046245.1 HAD-IIB family hydrolase [Vannielia litorea]MBY6073658.1 HAD-IIB family hydrolase [Vannielia litorea]